MKDLETRFRNVHEKLLLLLKKHQALERENEKLQATIDSLKKEQAEIQEASEQLKMERDILKMSAGTLDEKEKKELNRQLNRYISELDKCIAQLS
jgi:hypothetical protein